VRDTETGALLAERAEPLGTASNNVAEYRGLIAGLEAAHAIDPGAEVLARMDSKLVVEQMSGRWKIKHEDMRRLALQARDIAARITSAGGTVRYEWIPREINKDADALSNVAMDGRTVNRTFAESESTGQEPAGELDAAGDAADAGGDDAEADEADEAVRVVLVAAAASRDAAGATASAVLSVVGTGGIEVVGGVADAVDVTARAIGDALGTEVEVDPCVGLRRARCQGRLGSSGRPWRDGRGRLPRRRRAWGAGRPSRRAWRAAGPPCRRAGVAGRGRGLG
jgi:ribonuclease HI